MYQLLESVLIGIGTGILSGIITGIGVTRYYRKKDDIRDKENYVFSLKRHIISVFRILKQLHAEETDVGKKENISELRRELLYYPRFEKRFALSEHEKFILAEYEKHKKNLQKELKEYSRCTGVIDVYEKTKEDEEALKSTKDQLSLAIDKLGVYNNMWMILVHKLDD